MLSDREFVRQSLELNLFFLRIAKEHAIFMEAAFTPRDFGFAEQADLLKDQLTRLLSVTISLADGNISQETLNSGELFTRYTLDAERVTQYYTGIDIDTNITVREAALSSGMPDGNLMDLVDEVTMLNERIMLVVTALIEYKVRLLDNVLRCRLFTYNYQLLLDHILREARFYLNHLMRIQNRVNIDMVAEAVEEEIFWNRIMAEHAKFIRGLLDPTEVQLFNMANDFGREFDRLTAEALELTQQIGLLPMVTEESLEETVRIRDFKIAGTQGLLQCTVKAIAAPLLGDHVIREANHYLRLLRSFSMREDTTD